MSDNESSGSYESENYVEDDNDEMFKKLTENEKDELLFDTDEDEDNDNWIRENFSNISITNSNNNNNSDYSNNKTVKKNNTYLSCPACFTLLCIDCQRHDRFKNQYRAMFVKNCTVVIEKRFTFKDQDENGKELIEYYHPVYCEICDTQVGVYDEDEVYHFFNIFPSCG
ncbi:hypothetical protein DLAC_01365 [Tieghemostelium lacteum]|uniref:E2F-associated phosphoprotein n=1 Tax=Tieghemostelium lacteum TaxID=361077 RepID=A0A152A8S1_TIELA|nr:hypothetical protein DLAC_01365 [Tieghemostelium lacteum]|eukprot:KYR02521.1 hypothetical protein DLAC_01365 [Tieghemostelium lacteum]